MMLHDDDIRTLLAEARSAGDAEQAELCLLALHGTSSEVRDDARGRCADAARAARDAWTFNGWWAIVLGASRSADDVVREFELDPSDRRELDQWLATAELEAWREGNLGGEQPKSWEAYHARALDELCAVPVAPPAEYLATWASVADEIVTKGITIGRTTARGNTMPVLAELVVHSCQRDSFGPDGDGVVLVDDGDGWRRFTDAEHEAWTNALRDAWQARIEPTSYLAIDLGFDLRVHPDMTATLPDGDHVAVTYQDGDHVRTARGTRDEVRAAMTAAGYRIATDGRRHGGGDL